MNIQALHSGAEGSSMLVGFRNFLFLKIWEPNVSALVYFAATGALQGLVVLL